tara:strand:- start:286 stop:720 length:435 start_codon:yes stop_codon:yes gene_type:complete
MVDFIDKYILRKSGRLTKKKPTSAPRYGGGSPATDYKSKSDKNMPSYMKTTTKPLPGNISKGSGNPYTPTQLKSVGPDMGRDARISRSDGKSVPGKKAVKKKAPVPKHLISKDTPSGKNRMDKKKEYKPKYRTKVTMTSMRVKY